MNLTLSAFAALVGLDAQGLDFLSGAYGAQARPREEWAALLAALLAAPETAWLSGCLIVRPSSTGPVTTDPLPEGEGFFERDGGVVQATPLLRGQGAGRVLDESRLDGYAQAAPGAFAREREGGLTWTPLLVTEGGAETILTVFYTDNMPS